MRNLDFTPLHRASIGFDRIFDLLESASQTLDNWPPCDTIKLSEDDYRIVMAVAGFARDEIDVSLQSNLLQVTGEHKSQPEGEVLHRGIAYRPFTRRFQLAEHMQVTGANLNNGLLTIELKREVPEAMKPRRIPIEDAGNAPHPSLRQLQSEAA